jgi:hypothetical protein
MLVAREARSPEVLSYLTLRKAVGWIALCLPFALIVPWWLIRGDGLPSSISGYYYTGMRNLLVGSLCAIGMFNLCCRGYDRKDEAAGIFSALCAIGVAFCPLRPQGAATADQRIVGRFHIVFAILLFLTLAYFCLVLFRMTAANVVLTRNKILRNRVYTVCGCVILASIVIIPVLGMFGVEHLGPFGVMFCFETTALVAFGVAWLVKGETILEG